MASLRGTRTSLAQCRSRCRRAITRVQRRASFPRWSPVAARSPAAPPPRKTALLPLLQESECHSPYCILELNSTGRYLANFSAYNARFPMPGPESGGVAAMWYSWCACAGGRDREGRVR